MRWIVVAILLMFALRTPFTGANGSICIADDHVAVNCHNQPAEPACPAQCGDAEIVIVQPSANHCLDVTVVDHELQRGRPLVVVDPLFAVALLKTLDMGHLFDAARTPAPAAFESPPPAFCALDHARTIVIRC